jgi:hypothetical protein
VASGALFGAFGPKGVEFASVIGAVGVACGTEEPAGAVGAEDAKGD